MEGTRPNAADYGGHPAPTGPALTNDLCGQYVKIKIKVKVKTRAVFDFNILTAFIRLGRARPVGAGCPPYYYYLTLVQYFKVKVKVKVKINVLRPSRRWGLKNRGSGIAPIRGRCLRGRRSVHGRIQGSARGQILWRP